MRLEELKCKSESIDIGEYIKLTNKIKSTMTNPEWLGDLGKEDIKYLLDNGSKIYIFYKEDKPICSMMSIKTTEDTLREMKIDLDYREVIDYGPMFVNPKYIGNGLQYQMLQKLDEINKNYKYAISTVSPDNIYSIDNLIKDGFEIKGRIELNRGPRNIYLKKHKKAE